MVLQQTHCWACQNTTAARLVPRFKSFTSHVRRSKPVAASRTRTVAVAAVFSTTTTNPAFTFGNVDSAIIESRRGSTTPMTFDGTVNKAGLLLGLSTISAAYTWMQVQDCKLE
eukprot:GHRR01011261.1.p1 GENE.GHRR01011261.1~~GHRR01011261.1.p1  ORF type:complete len:113 (+),score=28.65 GHRR01011261.1:426-764(+)